MSDTITRSQVIVVQDCCACFIPFGVPKAFDEKRLKDKQTFYCPNGHPQSYIGKSDEQLLRDEKKRRANAEEEARIQAARALQAEQEAARLKQRAKGGACPCCNRTFVQLARHMKSKHPDHVA